MADKALTDEQTYLIVNECTEPSFNLSAEEYFFYSRRENYIMLWRNNPSIIIGKNQNAYAELDMDYTDANSIPVIRRLTGGGAVFHDLGNLNFTFIKNGQEGMADFREYLSPVTEYLRSLGLNADFSGRNDILLDGAKISGTAQTSSKGRVLLHGTLLFSASLETLALALKPNPLKLAAKGIKSVKSRVTNIASHLPEGSEIISFRDGLSAWLTKSHGCVRYDMTSADTTAVEKLACDKYNTFTWNIGSAPPYSIEKTIAFDGGIITAYFEVKSGSICDIRLYGDFFGTESVNTLESALKNVPYEPNSVTAALSGTKLEKYVHGVKLSDFTRLLFK